MNLNEKIVIDIYPANCTSNKIKFELKHAIYFLVPKFVLIFDFAKKDTALNEYIIEFGVAL